jgi:hypothetical protein
MPNHRNEFEKLTDGVLKRVYARSGQHKSYLLPMAFPEGCPLHPAYGAGHATVAGACVTVLKALFKEDARFTQELGLQPVVPTRNGQFLKPYKGADADQMTVGSELNKLASNVGMARNFAGVHWRTDYTQSVELGEKVALYVLQEHVQTYNEDAIFSVTRLTGEKVTLRKGDAFRDF